MKILLVATKPPWPLIDGGRLLLWHTMAGLVRHGAEITLVAPVGAGSDCAAVGHELRTRCRPMLVAPPRRMRVGSFAQALVGGATVSIALHRFAAMREQVGALLAAEAFDLIHAEQLQAVANCDGARLFERCGGRFAGEKRRRFPSCCDRRTSRAICGAALPTIRPPCASCSCARRAGSARGKRKRCGVRTSRLR